MQKLHEFGHLAHISFIGHTIGQLLFMNSHGTQIYTGEIAGYS